MRIVYLVAKKRFETKMSRGARFHTMQALGRKVEVVWTGNGWPGYDESATVSQNVQEAAWLVAYKPEDHLGVKSYTGQKAIVYNEAWWPDGRAAQEVVDCGADLVVCHHENDLPRFGGCGARVVHIPHCAEASIFSGPGKDRSIDCLVPGVQSPEIYPLRARWRKLIESGLPGEIRRHPGYRLRSAEACEQQCRNYAAHLRRAKIVLTCSSKYRYALAKYVEAMAAGALVIGDMPDDSSFRNSLGRCIVEVDPDAPETELVETVRWWLDHEKERAERAQAGTELAVREFSMERWADRFLEAIG